MLTPTTIQHGARPAFAGALLAATSLTSAFLLSAWADPPQNSRDGLVTKGEVQSGSLLLASSEPGKYVEAPLVAAQVKMDIAGPVIRTRLTQRFTNPTDKWVQGVYAFPLPEDAAVDTLKIVIGDRFVEGDIKERKEARQVFEEAARNGQRAGLVEEERPNLFTSSLANIGPGETVAIQIEFEDKAHLDNGVWSTRFPLVVAPRYIPKPAQPALVADATGRIGIGNPRVPDADKISPPVLHPALEPSGPEGLRLPVSFDISLEAGVPLASITSQTHGLKVDKPDADTAHITLTDKEVPADRDFVLSWKPEPATMPKASLFREERNGEQYLLAVVNPPAIKVEGQRRDRETIFVIDNSGSMSGPSMDQAKKGLLLALDHLQPTDEFNIIRFDDTMDVLFRTAVPANPQNLANAKRFVSNLQANGGTEMLPALKAALVDKDRENTKQVRQVVFMTDGAIGNEDELFAAIHDNLGRSRLFTVGIGSAPNAYFMTRAARQGRGTFTFMDDSNKIAEQSAKLFSALENPVMTDLAATLPSAASDVYPSPLPDLYSGEPVTLLIRADQLKGDLKLSGKLNGKDWTTTLSLADAAPTKGIAQLWGRAKISGIEESRYAGIGMEAVDAGVLKTALDFHLVSRLTSLVAIDKTPARPASERLDITRIATMLPAGWDFGAVFGPEAEARALRFDRLPDNVLQRINARTTQEDTNKEKDLALPQTASGWEMTLAFGLSLLLFGAALLRGRSALALRGAGHKARFSANRATSRSGDTA
ncbi:MAG TPA: marine proteobacterial sortase target protein [Hyphomonadaceae bacterium]|nr:marine proteobacterial sortase target protein [Hyphomonadaceae bacterium]